MVVPPTRFGLAIDPLAPPFESAPRGTAGPVQCDFAVAWVQVCDLAQQQRFARPGGSGDGRAFACSKVQADRGQALAVYAAQPENGPAISHGCCPRATGPAQTPPLRPSPNR
ncbi:hypothetical protein G6F65_023150 [Rhizopus arrhizus]|nr:hypothetical protein G6F65_023150 [Rhizopus arrhizus]